MSIKDEDLDQDESGTEGFGDVHNDRAAFLNGIADKLDEDEDSRDHGSDNGYLKDDEDFEDDDFEEEDEAPQAPAPQKHKIRVNGKELELSYEELVARAQKVEAADEYLRQAAQAAQTNINTNTSRPSPDVNDYVEEDDIALVRALQMGDEREAVAAIRKLKQGPSIKQDDISRMIDEKVKFQKAAEYFQTEYQDILSDPYLAKMAFARDQELTSSGDSRDYMERYTEIGNEIRGWMTTKTGAIQNESNSVQKQQRKASMSQVPSAAVRSGSSRRGVEQEENASDVIAQIAKSRGQI